MGSRNRFLFMMPHEFFDLLVQATGNLGLDVILYRGPTVRLERWDGRDEKLAAATRVYLVAAPAALATAHSDSFRPGELGWVQLDVPPVENRDLFGVQLAAKGDWFDAARREIRESPVALKLFDRLLRSWKKHFTFRVLARDVKTGAEALYPSIGYSTGAAACYRQGGSLRKTAVANVAYGIPPPDTRGLPRREK